MCLFGSVRSENFQPERSDLDMAVLTKELSYHEYLALEADLSLLLKSDRFHRVWLNEADPVMKFNVLKTGRLIFYRDATVLNEFRAA